MEWGQQHPVVSPSLGAGGASGQSPVGRGWARPIDADGRLSYGQGVDGLETLVDRERFRGRCYRAANWEWVGQTQGRSRQDRGPPLQVPIKDVYGYDLKSRRSR